MIASFTHLLQQKATIPERVKGYLNRADLLNRAYPLNQPLTILRASAGFGKTTLLSECCRTLRRQEVITAWLSLDERDSADILDLYIAFAFHQAGITSIKIEIPDDTLTTNATRTRLIIQHVQSINQPFVIAFDEVERLKDPKSIALLDFLIQRAPTNLHIAVAGREIPSALNVAHLQMNGCATLFKSEDLRFSNTDIARFYKLSLNPDELQTEIEETLGWPIALRITQNGDVRRSGQHAERTIWTKSDWIESRFLSQVSEENKNFILELSLFETFDFEMLDEVLNRNDSFKRIESLTMLEGLLGSRSTMRGRVWHLHPLIRDHCIKLCFRDNRKRFIDLHKKIGMALANRDEVVPAMRHAINGEDPLLAGEILKRAGGVRILIRLGYPTLIEAHRLLTEDLIRKQPRLKLVRCYVLLMRGLVFKAESLFQECPHPNYPVVRNKEHFDYAVEHALTQGALALYAGSTAAIDRLIKLPSQASELISNGLLDPLSRGSLNYIACISHFYKAEFDNALSVLDTTRQLLYGTHYLTIFSYLIRGQIEFIQGHPQKAKLSYDKATRAAKKHFMQDPIVIMSCRIVHLELSLECSSPNSIPQLPSIRNALKKHGVPFSLFATCCNLFIDARIQEGTFEQALDIVDDSLGFLRGNGYDIYARLLAAFRITLLILAGRVKEAIVGWQSESFATDPLQCTSLERQSWREMEAISEARVRLLNAMRRFDDSRTLLHIWHGVCVDLGLKRSQMRVLVLSIALEKQAGDLEQASVRLREFLELFIECRYVGSITKETRDCLPVLLDFIGAEQNPIYREEARKLTQAMQKLKKSVVVNLSDRQTRILSLLDDSSDKQIANKIGISVYGVRYHLRAIFSKMQVQNRAEAVKRGRKYGLIP